MSHTQILRVKLQPCVYVLKINPLNAELNPICHLLALSGAHHIFHVSGLRVIIFRGIFRNQVIGTQLTRAVRNELLQEVRDIVIE